VPCACLLQFLIIGDDLKMLKIVVEADSLVSPQAGIGKFNRNLLRNVLALDSKNDYQLYSFGDPIRKNISGFKIHWLWLPRKIYTGLLKIGLPLPYNFLTGRADLYFFPNFIRFPITLGKSVVVVHDLTFLKYPEVIEGKNLNFLKKFLPKSLAKADRVVVISQSTKEDLKKYFKIEDKKISVIYPSLPEELRKTPSLKAVAGFKKKNGLREYILFVGTLEPRKNIARLIEAVELVSEKFPEIQLVLVGRTGWGWPELLRRMERSSLGPRLKMLGYLEEEELALVYAGAKVFALPSLYEGFGLPVLEAFHYGVPVVTSGVSSLPEVAGDGAVLVDPQSVGEIAVALERVWGNTALREKLVKLGRRQLARFSWRQSARKLVRLFEEVGS
jgi:glycosyltransferase involved in cell wall biosynthesis